MTTRARTRTKARATGNGRGSEPSRQSTYDQFKEFQGQRYTGMKVGRRHKWRYDQGEWTERKITPDRWEFQYAVVKRRAGRAPEGSGAPVGTAYRWYIVADQVVTKLDANSYMTEMVGLKYKVAHRRADKTSWSASERNQRKRTAALLGEMASELEKEPPAASADGAADAPATTAKATTNGKKRASTHRPRATPSRARATPRRKPATTRRRAARARRRA